VHPIPIRKSPGSLPPRLTFSTCIGAVAVTALLTLTVWGALTVLCGWVPGKVTVNGLALADGINGTIEISAGEAVGVGVV
jgi:hypothetical protein